MVRYQLGGIWARPGANKCKKTYKAHSTKKRAINKTKRVYNQTLQNKQRINVKKN